MTLETGRRDWFSLHSPSAAADTLSLSKIRSVWDFILKGPWKGRKLHEPCKTTETPREWFPILLAHAQEVGITVLSSVFSEDDLDFLEGLDFPAYKIASMEITDTNLAARPANQSSIG